MRRPILPQTTPPLSVTEEARTAAVRDRESALLKALGTATDVIHETHSIQMVAAGGVRFRLTVYGDASARVLRSIIRLLDVNASILEEDGAALDERAAGDEGREADGVNP